MAKLMINDLNIDLDILPFGTKLEVSKQVLKVYNDSIKKDTNFLVSRLNYSFKLRDFLKEYGFEFVDYSTLEKPCIKLVYTRNENKFTSEVSFRDDTSFNISKHLSEWKERVFPNYDYGRTVSSVETPVLNDDSLDSRRYALEASMGLPKGMFGEIKQDKQDTLKDILRGF